MMNGYVRFDEQTNVLDSFEKAREFLLKEEYKWFLIAFHHGVHHLCLILLHRKNPFLIWKANVGNSIPVLTRSGLPNVFDRKNRLIEPMDALQKCLDFHDKRTLICDGYMLGMMNPLFKRLNNQMRNSFIHFAPMGWSLSHGHIKEICLPLTSLVIFFVACIDDVGLEPTVKERIVSSCETMANFFQR